MNLSKLKHTLRVLEGKFARRLRKQRKHYRKYERFHQAGKKIRAAFQLRQFRKHRKAVVKLGRLIETQKSRIAAERKRRASLVASGTGAWGGSESVAREVERFVESRRGECSGSEKRTATYGNPGSDHHVSQTNAYAIDFLLVNDYAMAREIARHFGVVWAGDYSNFYIKRGGRTFRIQIIAGTHGTGPHLHVGIRRA